MNFYKHHIGDYAAATTHLSILEDGVYSRLLRIYYRDEKPLPVEVKAVQRLAGARSRDEREAVQSVLEEFFELTPDGWRNKRADEEIAEAQEFQGEAGEKRKHEADRKRRYRQRRTELFDALRKVDIVPPFDTPMPELEALLSRGTRVGQAARLDGDGTANQTPDSRLQYKSNSSPPAGTTANPARDASPTDAGRACALMRQAGCVHTNPSHPDLLAALAAGVTPEVLADTVREAIANGKGNPEKWSIATALGRLEESRNRPAKPAGGTHEASPRPRRPSLAERAQQSQRELEARLECLEGSAVRVA